jgi:DNA-binding Lrp family transcriptional regulator
MDDLDRQLIDLLKVNARLPVVTLAKSLGVARSTVQARLKALEEGGTISGYTVSVTKPQSTRTIRSMVLISIESKSEPDVIRALTRRHEIVKLYSISGRYDVCGMLLTETTEELDAVLDRIRAIKGVVETFSTVMLSTKLDRPE